MQEHAADKTAVIFMKKLGIPIEGLINVLKKIKSSHVQLDAGLYKTHPGINERVNYLSGIHVKNTNLLLNNRSFLHSYNMMKAKVIGFIWEGNKYCVLIIMNLAKAYMLNVLQIIENTT
ncbi:MAG: hypothetical protein MRQ07_01670 [Candidatus Midichloria sp.]|nr:hypothetical protein [Candidatus Midichloria sp.]